MMVEQMLRTLLATRVARKLRIPFMYRRLEAYLASMSADNPLKGMPVRVVGDAWGDPTELFSHYSAFSYWVAAKLARDNRRYRILDIGSPKTQNAIFSASHDVTAVVLADCSDRLSAVNYVLHDVSQPLPFPDKSFDCFTSTVSLPLVGLGRYGDQVKADCLPDLILELERVMRDGGRLFFSFTSGPNLLAFNNSWFLDFDTIKSLFRGWRLVEALVDNWSSPRAVPQGDASRRFAAVNENVMVRRGDYRVIFFEFVKE